MNKRELLEYYYGNLRIIPVMPRDKKPVDTFSNFRKYTTDDIGDDENIAILTGTEVFRDAFLVVLDADIDFDTEKGKNIFEVLLKNCSDTVITKTGGKHNGFHIYYLTDLPVKSSLFTFNSGFVEIKGVHEIGYAEQVMLPPSVNLKKYQVIYPEQSDFVNFNKVRKLTTDELAQKIVRIKEEIKIKNL